MATTPWSVPKRKRGTPASAPPPRKRSKKGDTPSSSSTRQQTLTQAQWVTSAPSSFLDEEDLQPLEEKHTHSPRRMLRYRDSTLTQIDFFNQNIPPNEVENDLLTIDEEGPMPPQRLSQLDGIYDSPRKRKSSQLPVPAASIKRVHHSQGSKDYRPLSSRRDHGDSKETAQPLRSSKRIAQRKTLLSDPVDNFDFFEKALSQSPEKENVSQRRAKLEIQDSTDTEGGLESLRTQPLLSLHAENPITPKKRRSTVMSSQSPASLSPTKKTTRVGIDVRSPLRERSVNLPTVPPGTPISTASATPRPSAGTNGQRSRLSKKRSIKAKGRVEDSQVNIYSMPETSSPRKQRASPELGESKQAQAPLAVTGLVAEARSSTDRIEIPSTSQVPGYPDISPFKQDDGVSLNGKEPIAAPESTAVPAEDFQEQMLLDIHQPAPGIIVRDFAGLPVPDPVQERADGAKDQETTGSVAQTQEQEIGDSDSEFGSPIANDTQFNVDLEHRTSSPTRSSTRSSKSQEDPHDTQRLSDILQPPTDELVEVDADAEDAPLSTPVPRLVARSSPSPELGDFTRAQTGSDEFLLPPIPKHDVSTTQTSTSRVPLNDVLPSSSPALPTNRFITQRSVHPASLPHPSQVSTQEATQAYLGQSSMILGEEQMNTSGRPERISIKDDSSMMRPMSQIPAHKESEQLDVSLGIDDLDTIEDEDYDLDPPSITPKGTGKLRTPRKSRSPTKTLESAFGIPSARQTTLPAGDNEDNEETADPSPSRTESQEQGFSAAESLSSPCSQTSASVYSPLRQNYTPIPGFNNETQSNFTQNGHVSAAYIHRQRDAGLYPKWFVPKPHQVPGYTRR